MITGRRPWVEKNAKDLFLYEMQWKRVVNQESMLWQPAALSLTAQAFLLTIALGPDAEPLSRLAAALLGIAVSTAALCHMWKQRFVLDADSVHLAEIEERLGFPDMRHRRREDRKTFWLEARGLQRWRAYWVWLGALFLFFLTNLAVSAREVLVWVCGSC